MTRKELQAIQSMLHVGTLMSHRLYDVGTRDDGDRHEQEVLLKLHDRWQEAVQIFRGRPVETEAAQ